MSRQVQWKRWVNALLICNIHKVDTLLQYENFDFSVARSAARRVFDSITSGIKDLFRASCHEHPVVFFFQWGFILPTYILALILSLPFAFFPFAIVLFLRIIEPLVTSITKPPTDNRAFLITRIVKSLRETRYRLTSSISAIFGKWLSKIWRYNDSHFWQIPFFSTTPTPMSLHRTLFTWFFVLPALFFALLILFLLLLPPVFIFFSVLFIFTSAFNIGKQQSNWRSLSCASVLCSRDHRGPLLSHDRLRLLRSHFWGYPLRGMEFPVPNPDRTESLAIHLFDHYRHSCRRGTDRLFFDHAKCGFCQEHVKVCKGTIFGIGSCNDCTRLRVRHGEAFTHCTGAGPFAETAIWCLPCGRLDAIRTSRRMKSPTSTFWICFCSILPWDIFMNNPLANYCDCSNTVVRTQIYPITPSMTSMDDWLLVLGQTGVWKVEH